MKKTLKTMLAIVAGAAAITACQKENFVEGGDVPQTASVLKPMTFTASMEGHNGGTRATIDGSHYATDQRYDVKWVAGDKISVFDGSTENNGNQKFTLNAGDGTTSGTFQGNAATGADVYYAIYPYVASSIENRVPTRAEAEIAAGEYASLISGWEKVVENPGIQYVINDIYSYVDKGKLSEENMRIIYYYLAKLPTDCKNGPQRNTADQFENIVLPAEQTVTEGQCIDPKAMLMIAKSADASTLQFKNVCAYVKVTPQFDCYAIALRSTDATKKLAGIIKVDYNDGAPTATVTANGTNEVFLTGTIKADNTYYIAVLPGSLASGFTIEFLDKDMANYYARSTSKTLVLTRNNVTNLGSFATSGAWSIKTATSGTDDKGHSWKLVSPMLKLATAVDGTCDGNADFSTFTWGNDWVLLSIADVQPLIDVKAISRSGKSQDWTVNISGLGVLRYMDVFSINSQEANFWLDDIDASNFRYALVAGNMTTVTVNKETQCNLLYKYVGE